MSKAVSGPGAPALEADVALRDGSTVHVRPTRAGDEAAILAFLGGLSEESRYFRFFSGAPNLKAAAHQAAISDLDDRCSLIALVGTQPTIVAQAGYVRNDGDREFPDVRPDEAAGIISSVLASGARWLTAEETQRLLNCYGIPLVPARFVSTPADAAAAGRELGGPLVLKAMSPTLLHKSDAGGVRLGLSPDGIEAAAAEMVRQIAGQGHELQGFQVQAMVTSGVEMLVGVVHDPLFGPVLACGAGGTTAELLKDVAVRITPLSDLDAREMLRSLKTFPLLDGYRGAPKADVAALEELMLRVSAMVEGHAEIAELDCNPAMVTEHGAVVVDASVRLEMPVPRRPIGAR